jgi:hypothetical protein
LFFVYWIFVYFCYHVATDVSSEVVQGLFDEYKSSHKSCDDITMTATFIVPNNLLLETNLPPVQHEPISPASEPDSPIQQKKRPKKNTRRDLTKLYRLSFKLKYAHKYEQISSQSKSHMNM